MKLIISIHHKKIALYYFIFSIMAGVVGVFLSLGLRLDLNGMVDGGAVGGDMIDGRISIFSALAQYGQEASTLVAFFASTHALLMIFFMVIPALFGGFATWLVPMMIGSDDISFPRLHLVGLLLLLASFFLLLFGLFSLPSPRLFYILMLVVLHLAMICALILSINLCTTILTHRPPGMGFAHMPSFVWSVLVASFMMIVTLPVLGATTTSIMMGAVWHVDGTPTTLLPPLPMMMWFLTHPELYVLLLPSFGIVTQIITTFSDRRLHAPHVLHGAMVVMGVFAFILWSQSLFGTKVGGMPDMQRYFSFHVPLIGLPVACIFTSWFVTLWRGDISFRVPMLWGVGFIFMMGTGILSAIGLVAATQYDMAALVSHFHYILALGSVFAIFCGWYFWFPKMSGYLMREMGGKLHFWLMFVGVHLTFLPPYFTSFSHAPTSFFLFVEERVGWKNLSNFGVGIIAISLICFFYTSLEAFIRKCRTPANPWGEGARTLEWSSPKSGHDQQWQNTAVLSIKE